MVDRTVLTLSTVFQSSFGEQKMGQSTSTTNPLSATQLSEGQLLALFSTSCSKNFAPIELLSIQNNFVKSNRNKDAVIGEDELPDLLGIKVKLDNLIHLLHNSLVVLANFPLINHDLNGLNYYGLIKAISLYNTDRCSRILGRQYNYIKLMFISFALKNNSKEKLVNEQDPLYSISQNSGSVSWADCSIVSDYDSIDINEMLLSASDALELVKFLLISARSLPQDPPGMYINDALIYDGYKTTALSIIRTMNSEISTNNLNKTWISFEQFQSALLNVAPNLLSPLSTALEHLLFDPTLTSKEKVSQTIPKPIQATSRLVDEHILAQLSTFLPKELVYANIRKLYIGADSGYSMRSFESKVFKWNAPTLLLISGSRINDTTTRNSRYKTFETHYPKLKSSALSTQHEGEKIIYGVYIATPWRITNKDSFGDSRTMMFQLSPQQKIFKSSISAKHFLYFNTLGGGIGVGSSQPIIKNNTKRYAPGNVSLTIDSTLEFCIFRHLGLGGEFRSANPKDINLEYEDRFLIKDVEVWGCGGEKELQEQNKQWEWEENEAKRRQHINLKSIGEDRALLEMAGLIGQHQSGGSV